MSDDLNLSTGSIQGLLDDTRRALERMSTPPAPGTDPSGEPTEPLRGDGESADGRARAVAVTPGRIETLEVNPRLMRDGSEAVCEAIAEAVNAALEDLQTKAVQGAATIDPQQLSGELERIQEESLDSARSMMAVLQDAMARIDRRT